MTKPIPVPRMTPDYSVCILKIYLPRTYNTTNYYFYLRHHLCQYYCCWGLRPLAPEPLLPLVLMGVTGLSVLVLAVGQGTCACAGRRGSGCNLYNCCVAAVILYNIFGRTYPREVVNSEGGWATNAGNMEYSAASFIERWDEEVLGGHVLGLRCWGHVCSRRRWCWYGGASGGRDYHHQARHRRFGFVRCGCGCDCKFSRKTLNGGCLPLAVAAEADTVLTRPAEQVE